MSRDFGFSKDDKRLDVSKFSPRESVAPKDDADDLGDRAADRAGFKSREVVERVARVRKPSQPFDQAFVRAPIDVINRFKTFCNDTGMSYGEALDELMRRAKL
ncbi:hypothetical protein [Aliirhizobium smilacinae]|uniref:Uncharacterized protein n=1 Tax=Aliirhizobium smilacinae TaxID=1395944 RepID=A0A5C4XRZ8_9HYPH|nr:hypothetical protein [Rhizobium smilacinae]TNM66142.1 hypothetical protein FHP24_07970 [Rhizobium smilacinae]